MRIFRLLFLIPVSALALVLAAVFLLPHLMDADRIKRELADHLARVAGREVRIEGKLEAALLPSPGLRVFGLSMADAGGFGNGTMISCRSMHVGLDLAELLVARLSVVRFDMDDLALHFHRDAAGVDNWDGLFPGDPGDAASHGEGPAFLDKPDLAVKNATITMSDKVSGAHWSLEELDLDLDGETREYRLATTLNAPGFHRFPFRFQLVGTLHGGVAYSRAAIKNSLLTMDYDVDGDGGVKPARIEMLLDMDLFAGNLNSTRVSVSSPGVVLLGHGRAENLYRSLSLDSVWKGSASNVREVCLIHHLPVPGFAMNSDNARVGAEFRLRANMEEVWVDNATLSFSNTVFKGGGGVRFGDEPRFYVKGRTNRLDFSEILVHRANATKAPPAVDPRAGEDRAGERPPFDAVVDLRAEKFQAGKLRGRNLVLDAEILGGNVTVRSFNADFERGGLAGSGAGSINKGRVDALLSLTLRGLPRGRITGDFVSLASARLHFLKSLTGFSGHMDVQPNDPRSVLWALDVPWPEALSPHAVGEVSASYDFQGRAGEWKIFNATLGLGKTRVRGWVERRRGRSPGWEFLARADSINLDTLLSDKPGPAEPLARRFSWLAGADFKGAVRIDRLVWQKEPLANVRATIAAAKSRLSVVNGGLSWAGGQGGGEFDLVLAGNGVAVSGGATLKGLRAEVAASRLGLPKGLSGRGDLRFKGKTRGADAEELLASLTANATAEIAVLDYTPASDPGESLFRIKRGSARIGVRNATGLLVKKGKKGSAPPERSADLVFSVAGPSAVLDGEGVKNFSLGGEARLTFGQQGLNAVRVDRLTARGVPELFESGKPHVSMSLTGDFNLEARHGEISEAVLSGPGFTAHARVTGEWGDDWAVQGDFTLPDARPAELWTALYNLTPRQGELMNGSAQVGFAKKKGGPAELDVRLGVDKGLLMGRFTVRDFAQPDLDFTLHATDLDLDRWQDPEPEENATDPATGLHWADEPFALDFLRRVSARGTATLGNSRVLGVLWGDAKASLNTALGRAELRVSDSDLYGGSGELWLRTVTRSSDMTAETSVKMRKVESGRFIAGLAGGTVLRGKADLILGASAQGSTWRTLARTLAGKASLSIEKGAVIPRAEEAGGKEIPFTSLTATFDIARGVIRNNDLKARASAYEGLGSGTLDLPNDAMVHYVINARGPAITSVPIALNGPLDDVTVDVSSLGVFLDSLGRVMSLPLQPLYFIKDLLF